MNKYKFAKNHHFDTLVSNLTKTFNDSRESVELVVGCRGEHTGDPLQSDIIEQDNSDIEKRNTYVLAVVGGANNYYNEDYEDGYENDINSGFSSQSSNHN